MKGILDNSSNKTRWLKCSVNWGCLLKRRTLIIRVHSVHICSSQTFKKTRAFCYPESAWSFTFLLALICDPLSNRRASIRAWIMPDIPDYRPFPNRDESIRCESIGVVKSVLQSPFEPILIAVRYLLPKRRSLSYRRESNRGWNRFSLQTHYRWVQQAKKSTGFVTQIEQTHYRLRNRWVLRISINQFKSSNYPFLIY